MASDQEAANALKVQGNKAFAQHEWPAAIDFYTQAIEKYDKEPSFFCNRAQVRRHEGLARAQGSTYTMIRFSLTCGLICYIQAQIKLEAFGYAVADATAALELDPNYVKVSHYWTPPTLKGTQQENGCGATLRAEIPR